MYNQPFCCFPTNAIRKASKVVWMSIALYTTLPCIYAIYTFVPHYDDDDNYCYYYYYAYTVRRVPIYIYIRLQRRHPRHTTIARATTAAVAAGSTGRDFRAVSKNVESLRWDRLSPSKTRAHNTYVDLHGSDLLGVLREFRLFYSIVLATGVVLRQTHIMSLCYRRVLCFRGLPPSPLPPLYVNVVGSTTNDLHNFQGTRIVCELARARTRSFCP